MTSRRVLAIVPAVALALAACSADESDLLTQIVEQRKQAAALERIKPPEAPDPLRTGRVGVLVATNSLGWVRTLGVAASPGAVVLLVVPGSPAARGGLARGDLIVRVGDTPVANDERARVALRGREGVPLNVTVVRANGPVQIELTPGPPSTRDLAADLDAALRRDPRDATALLLRAGEAAKAEEALTFTNRALEAQPDLVDALVFRARLYSAGAAAATDEAVAEEGRRRAAADYGRALDVDPDSTYALVSRGTGSIEIQQFDAAERDALRVIGIDATLASAHALLAAARARVGRIGDALVSASEAVRLDPFDANNYRLVAAIFVALGRRTDAEATVREGLTVAGDDEQRAALQQVLEAR